MGVRNNEDGYIDDKRQCSGWDLELLGGERPRKSRQWLKTLEAQLKNTSHPHKAEPQKRAHAAACFI